ncbi:hypothetical protein D3C71_1918730 [compost metagenome]
MYQVAVNLSNQVSKEDVNSAETHHRQWKIKEYPVQRLKYSGTETCSQVKIFRRMMSYVHGPE